MQRCKDNFIDHSSFLPDKGNRLEFAVQHYAGQVLYRIEGFLEKNKDSLPETLVDSVKYGEVKLIRTLFRRPANPNSDLKKSILRKRWVMYSSLCSDVLASLPFCVCVNLQSEVSAEGNVQEVFQEEEAAAGKGTKDTYRGRTLHAEPEGAHGEDIFGFSSLHTLHQAKLQKPAKAV